MAYSDFWYILLSAYHIVVIIIGYQQVAKAFNMKTKLLFFEDGKNHVWKFVSVWVQILNQVYFHIRCIYQISKAVKSNKKIHRLRTIFQSILQHLLFAIEFPLTMMICLGFWIIFLFDRRIMYPKEMDDLFPFYYCHIYHTVPAVLVLIEISRGYNKPPELLISLKILCSFTVLYTAVLFKSFLDEKKWVYLFFYEMTVTEALLAHVFCFVAVPIIMLLISFPLHDGIMKIRNYLARMKYNVEITSSSKHIMFLTQKKPYTE